MRLRAALPVAATCLALVGCSPERTSASLEAIEARLRSQEDAHRRLDRDLGRVLTAMAERMELLADSMGDDDDAVASPRGEERAAAANERLAARVGPVGGDGLLHAPVSPARELEMQRRTSIWIAAVVGAVLAVATTFRLRSRAARVNEVGEPGSSAEDDLDAGAWDEASILTDAVPHRSEATDPAPLALDLDDAPEAQPEPAPRPRSEPVAAAAVGAESTAVAPVAVAPSKETASGPTRCAYRIDCEQPMAARKALESYLRHDPRVLQKPEPVVRAREGGLSVECSLLPGLPAGEREHLRAVLERLTASR